MKKTLILSLFALATTLVHAQNPFRDIGIPDSEVPVMTLSNGEFPEFHDQERYVQIGRILFDTKTMKVSDLNYKDTTHSEATFEPSVSTRWLAPDPLRQYPSPYKGMGNNPVNRVDPDGGLDIYTMDEKGNISLSKLTADNFDELHDVDGNLIVGGIRKGILQEGQNFLTKFNMIDLTFDEVSMDISNSGSAQSFILQLSKHLDKEIAGIQLVNDDAVSLLVVPSAMNDWRTSRSIPWLESRSGRIWTRYTSGEVLFRERSFKMISWFHTHPGSTNGEGGFVKPSFGDQRWTDNFNVPGHIYGIRGGFNTTYPKK
ncbi:MAG: hypothetical protein AAF693_12920 [Bacteroidota bacterium]